MKISASDKRLAAIKALVEQFVEIKDGKAQVVMGTTRYEVMVAMRDLYPMGRTDRWTAAVDAWRDMVGDFESELLWGILQGSIGAGYAAL